MNKTLLDHLNAAYVALTAALMYLDAFEPTEDTELYKFMIEADRKQLARTIEELERT